MKTKIKYTEEQIACIEACRKRYGFDPFTPPVKAERPCTCKNIETGRPPRDNDCLKCWLWTHDYDFRIAHGGNSDVFPILPSDHRYFDPLPISPATNPNEPVAPVEGINDFEPGKSVRLFTSIIPPANRRRTQNCLYLGPVLDRRSKSCSRCHVHECEIFGKCVLGDASAGLPVCETCDRYEPENSPVPYSETLPRAAKELYETLKTQPPFPNIENGWHDRDSVREAHLALLEDAVAKNYKYPGKFEGRGIVIPAGGTAINVYSNHPEPYFRLALQCAYTLRRRGCKLPIQFWFMRGELQEAYRALAACVGAECVDAWEIGVQQQMRCPRGWQFKVYTILNCPFKDVLYLDADNNVTRDPEYLFDSPQYSETGSLFWEDQCWEPIEKRGWPASTWRRLGLPPNMESDFESAQMYVDKERNWTQLQIAKHFADHSEYWGGFNNNEGGGVWHGDKSDYHAAWRKTGQPYYLFKCKSFNGNGFFMHLDNENRLLFQHACRKKGHLVEGKEIPDFEGNDIVHEASLLREKIPWVTVPDLTETDKLVNPEKHFDFGEDKDGVNRKLWWDIVSTNNYGLPEKFEADDVIVDLGGYQGAFSYCCLKRGAGLVEVVEPNRDYVKQLHANLAEFKERVNIVVAAVVGDPDAGQSTLRRVDEEPSHLSIALPGEEVGLCDTLCFDALMNSSLVDRRVRFLKLSCGGCEWGILYNSRQLHRVDQLAGVCYLGVLPAEIARYPKTPPWTGKALVKYLTENGFDAKWTVIDESGGFIEAVRRKRNGNPQRHPELPATSSANPDSDTVGADGDSRQ